jgi:hypothetical protein
MARDGNGRWSRRSALGALAAAGLLPALPALGGGPAAFPRDALRRYARAVGADPRIAALGRAAAGDRDAGALEAALRDRIPAARSEADWRAGLLAAGREDVARGHWAEVAGRRMVRVEAEFLGLAARLQLLA